MGVELNLYDIISAAENEPYVLGQHDCLRVACRVVESRTGIDYWPRFAGYTTHRQALVTIARIAPSLGEAISATLGIQPCSPLLAQRGDLVLYCDVEDHIGVCVGEHVVVLGPNGLLRIIITSPALRAAWRIESCPHR